MKKILLMCLLISASSFGQAVLVEDINLGNGSSSPSNKIIFNNEAYFAASNGINGNELWKTDGTEIGTVMVKDLVAGEDSGLYSGLKAHVANGELLFFKQTSFNEHELWKTDGTGAGTVFVKAIPNGNVVVQTDLNGELIFSVGDTLWTSDGTAAGTVQFMNIGVFGNRFIKSGSTIYFTGSSFGSVGYELWKTNGTAAGTVMIKDIRLGTGNSFPNYFAEVNGSIFFTANDGTNGAELWKTDGTEVGTTMIKNLTAGSGNTNVNYFAVYNNEYFFNNSGTTNLYKSDGTEAGTVLVKDVVDTIKDIVVFNNTLYVFNYATTFWESDGTTAGTVSVTTEVDEFYHNGTYAVVGNEMYFQGRNECYYQLWKTDGTAVGTVMLKAILPVWDDGHINSIVDLNGVAILTANDGTWHGNELWMSDGTSAGTQMLKDINETGNQWSDPTGFYDFNGTLLFSADNGVNGRELWKKVGANTTMVKDINVGNLFSSPSEFVELNGLVYFKAATKLYGTELWQTDGTESGTIMVKDINPDAENGLFNTGNIVVMNSKLYFYANDGAAGFELWESDGTDAGTQMVKDINVGVENSIRSGELIVYNGKILFNANDGSSDFELWASDGTNGGTALLKNLNSTSSGSPDTFIEFNGLVYFTASAISQKVLWMTDGTAAGTVFAGGSATYPNSLTVSGSNLYYTANGNLWRTDGTSMWNLIDGYPSSLTDHNGTLFFVTNVGSTGNELWKTDGTVATTTMVKDIVTGSNNSSNISDMVSFGGYMLFGSGDNYQNKELWKSDGTEAGTVLLQDLNPSVETFGNGSNPKNFFVQGNTLYFSANNGTIGVEPYVLADSALSVSEEVLDANVYLYPNPVQSTFQISLKNANIESIKIYSILGSEVLSIAKNNLPTDNIFDVSNLQTGIYLVKINTNISSITKKIIKR